MRNEQALRECLRVIIDTLGSNVLADPDTGSDVDTEWLLDTDCPLIADLCEMTLRMSDDGEAEALAEIERRLNDTGRVSTQWINMLSRVVEAYEKENFPLD